MTAPELITYLKTALKAGQIDETTNVVYGTQSQALDVVTVRIVNVSIRDDAGKTIQIVRRVLLT